MLLKKPPEFWTNKPLGNPGRFSLHSVFPSFWSGGKKKGDPAKSLQRRNPREVPKPEHLDLSQ
jgi:hypothetical protein